MADVAGTLNAAADLLEKPGAWTQGEYGLDEDGYGLTGVHQLQSRAVCLCTVGALAVAGNAASIRYAEEEADAVHALASVLGISVGRVAAWNDAPGRTQAEVVAALREAALRSTHPTGADQ